MADQVLQDIKDRLDVAEIIGGYIQLKKAGANFKANCPFHNEKSASLMVSPSKQIWHCFGCGEGGDVFGFVMKYENLEFRDALKALADKAGVSLPEYNPRSQEEVSTEEQLLKINDFAARYYHEILLKDKRAESARQYLKRRGLKAETIEQWKIGFAPDDFHALEKVLVQKKVPLLDLVKAGVSVKNDRGQVYDRFRGRITFPIFNTVGDTVGFTARIMPEAEALDKTAAKYINSPETPIYNKSKVLFGFHFAKNAIRKADEVIIVEGQMDCISAYQAGFQNIVASSGTALTDLQLQQIGRFTKNLKFCFDGDAAGLAATKRAVGQYLGKDFLIKIITLKDAKDPDELIKKDPKEFERAVKNAVLFLDFYIAKSFEQFDGSVEKKKLIAKELLPLLNYLTDPLEQDHYIKLLAEKFDTIPSVLLETLHKIPKGKRPASQTAAAKTVPALKSVGASGLEKQVLGGMMLYKDLLELVKTSGNPEDFVSPEARELAGLLLAGKTSQELGDSLLAKECIFMVESGLAEQEGGDDAMRRELRKSFAMLRLNAIKNIQKEINTRMKIAEEQKQKDTLLALNQQFAQLSKLRVEFEKML